MERPAAWPRLVRAGHGPGSSHMPRPKVNLMLMVSMVNSLPRFTIWQLDSGADRAGHGVSFRYRHLASRTGQWAGAREHPVRQGGGQSQPVGTGKGRFCRRLDAVHMVRRPWWARPAPDALRSRSPAPLPPSWWGGRCKSWRRFACGSTITRAWTSSSPTAPTWSLCRVGVRSPATMRFYTSPSAPRLGSSNAGLASLRSYGRPW